MKKILPILSGIGLAVPASLKQSQTAAHSLAISALTGMKPELLKALYEKTRIQKRGSVLFTNDCGSEPHQKFFWPQKNKTDFGPGTDERMRTFEKEAPCLALAASRSALLHSGVKAQEVSHLILVSCTGFSAPGTPKPSK